MPDNTRKILILGGTKEAAQLAEQLTGQGHDVVTSLAGRTKEPRPLAGDVRIGGFGGTKAMTAYLDTHNFDEIIDATHPFAEQISANAKKAAKSANTVLTVQQRPAWVQHQNDIWQPQSSLEHAVSAIPKGARTLLALGRQYIAPFETRKDVHFLIRMVDSPDRKLGFQKYNLILGKPSSDPAKEQNLLERHSISHIVCRNSGGSGAYAKIEAARMLQIPVIMIQRPRS